MINRVITIIISILMLNLRYGPLKSPVIVIFNLERESEDTEKSGSGLEDGFGNYIASMFPIIF